MMNRVACFCLAVWPCLAASAAGEPARDAANPSAWPQFRGPDGLGIAAERVKLPTHFGPSDHVLWITPLPLDHSSPCIWQARIFLPAFEPQTRQLETICLDRASVSEKGIVTCCDARTGEQRYRQRLGVRGTCYASPVVGDGKIYAASDGGTVVVFKPGDRFELLAKNEFDEGIVATPALVDDKIYIRTERRLYACGD